jgi:hypothetical protein
VEFIELSEDQARWQQALVENPFVVLQLDGAKRRDYSHYFTVGLSRFDRPELYIHHPNERTSIELLNDLGEQHLIEPLRDGEITLPQYKSQEDEILRFEARFLRGGELYAAVEKLSDIYMRIMGSTLTESLVYHWGIYQIFWPDEENLPISTHMKDGLGSMQSATPLTIQ